MDSVALAITSVAREAPRLNVVEVKERKQTHICLLPRGCSAHVIDGGWFFYTRRL